MKKSKDTEKPRFVLAGTYQQYLNFCYQHKFNPVDYKYLESEIVLMAAKEIVLYRAGTWWNSPLATSKELERKFDANEVELWEEKDNNAGDMLSQSSS